jgi:N-methylhydantoinase B
MSNTRNTPIEVIEMETPLRVRAYALRRDSGGVGKHRGGDGVMREFEALEPLELHLLTERRRHGPAGAAGGGPGAPGENLLNGRPLPAKVSVELQAGDVLGVLTPAGGGWGERNA